MKPILEISKVGKKFKIHSEQLPYLSLRDSIKNLVKVSDSKKDFWALRDVSFDVMPGDTIGVIGKNGAGKSTLLKILSKITPPTEGKIIGRGRIASLLEVGTGFHPELSGRENIFMNGSILGMRKKEIQRNFDTIVEFSGIGKFIYTPLKHYSSGMQLRLAFAVAAFLENEILIIDEVLAVGDAEFQKKCIGKMNEISKSGRTILFVSHNINAIKSLCAKGLFLQNGSVNSFGPIQEVINNYFSSLADSNGGGKSYWDNFGAAPGNDIIKLMETKLTLESEVEIYTTIDGALLEFKFLVLEGCENVNLSLHLYNIESLLIFNLHSQTIDIKKGIVSASMNIPKNLLNDGDYYVDLLVVKDSKNPVFNYNSCLEFRVEDQRENNGWHGKWEGAVRPNFIELKVSNGSD